MTPRTFVLASSKLAEIANQYEVACLLSFNRVRRAETDPAKVSARYIEMRAGIRLGIAQELRDLVCPEDQVATELAKVVNHAARKRALEGLPAKGRA